MKLRLHLLHPKFLFLVIVALTVAACGYTAPMKKDTYYVELEISLNTAAGHPLANYRFLGDRGYTDKLPKFTDEYGQYSGVFTSHNTPTTTFLGSGLLPPRELGPFSTKLWFYLPKVNLYGFYPVEINENGETRLLTMMPYEEKLESAGLDYRTEIKGPSLQITTRVTRLETRRGWHLKIDLILLDD